MTTRSAARASIWLLHLAFPVAGLWLLVARPVYDARWEHHSAHFWLVGAAGAAATVLSVRVHAAAKHEHDARLALVSLAFLAAAGFLLLHAVGTPGVLVTTNAGFVIATPVGLVVAALFAAASAFEWSGPRGETVLRAHDAMRLALLALVAAWAALALAQVPPFRTGVTPTEAHGPLVIVAVCGGALYAATCVAYARVYRRRPAIVLIGVLTGFALLGEALVAVAWGRNWRASWWEWHLLMLAGFAFILYSAHVQRRREGSATALFAGVGTDETIERIRREYGSAVEVMVDAMAGRLEHPDDRSPVTGQVAARFGLSEGQASVLEQAADALVKDREALRQLGELVGMGREGHVLAEESALVAGAAARLHRAFPSGPGPAAAVVGLLVDGAFRYPAAEGEAADTVRAQLDAGLAAEALGRGRAVEAVDAGGVAVTAAPLLVKDHPAGVVAVGGRALDDRDRALLESFAVQIQMSLENTRLYRHIDVLFRQYMSPGVVTALLADPAQAGLGGAVVEITSLFADLRGFTSYSERTDPARVVELLNRYLGVSIPVLLAHGGTVTQFAGDNVMAVFNAPTRQPDHALAAGRAALELQDAVGRLAPDEPDAPLFRIGINTGAALVGNVGAEVRCYTAIGDSVNLAARLEGVAVPGGVVVGEATRRAMGAAAVVDDLGLVQVKGKEQPVRAFTLRGITAA